MAKLMPPVSDMNGGACHPDDQAWSPQRFLRRDEKHLDHILWVGADW
jgi:hypothetical protein